VHEEAFFSHFFVAGGGGVYLRQPKTFFEVKKLAGNAALRQQ
jgi:hypothetical protein